ncbi:MAG: hypothetical protein ACLFVJ_17755 [Persicimonas sp.]
MDYTTSKPSSFSRRLTLLLAAVVALAATAGCSNPEEKALENITKKVEECRQSEPEGMFYTFELRGSDDTERVFKPACDMEIEKFELSSDVSAQAYTGPVRWGTRISKETDVWTLFVAEWPALERALNAIEGDEVDVDSRRYAESHFAQAQEQMPDNAWIRLRRLENLLDLRTDTRKKDDKNPPHIGDKAEKQLEETVAWAEDNDNPDAKAQAQYLAVDHVRTYVDKIDRILSADGSSDEWLIKAAEAAEKEGDKEGAEEYRDELEETRKKRDETQELFTERREQTVAQLCEQLDELSLDGVSDDAIKTQIETAKGSVDCSDSADKVAEGE